MGIPRLPQPAVARQGNGSRPPLRTTTMRPYCFSEFSYGFAVTCEFVRDAARGIVDPPEFPSTRTEGQSGGGADVRLNTPALITYLQFKLSDYMYGPTA